ncbi:MAG: putative phage abortive infection protein [Acidobacteria bacterium]|nr:putative phage abortive infection protein [Acidobacteriota bacterium]
MAATPLQRAIRAYDTFDRAHRPEVGHYFRNFYRVLKYVHETTLIDAENKASYTGVLRAQLSSHELVLLFYGTLHSVGEELKPLVEQYFIFDNLEFNRLYDPASEVPLYAESAYGQQNVAPYFVRSTGRVP